LIQTGQTIDVLKLNLQGQETWRYSARVLQAAPAAILLTAEFNRPSMLFHDILLGQGDPFIEIYFNDRWYNIFEIHAVQDDHLKGWYCNIVKPAVFGVDHIAQVDLALDLWINPDGTHRVLDQDEFDALPLDADTRQPAVNALSELLDRLHHHLTPFEAAGLL